jgi:hypothetical protein
VHTKNAQLGSDSDKLINLKGISIGDGAFDPAGQFYGFGDLLYHVGMVDQQERMQVTRYHTNAGASDHGFSVA